MNAYFIQLRYLYPKKKLHFNSKHEGIKLPGDQPN